MKNEEEHFLKRYIIISLSHLLALGPTVSEQIKYIGLTLLSRENKHIYISVHSSLNVWLHNFLLCILIIVIVFMI